MNSLTKFFLNALVTCIGCVVTFLVYYVMQGFEVPSFEKFTFGLAFYALFTAVEAKNFFK